jgi:DGQHR domain-containing protein
MNKMEELKDFIAVDVVPVNQFLETQNIFLGKITFKEMDVIQRLTFRKDPEYDPYDLSSKPLPKEKQEFQRHLQEQKLNRIAKDAKVLLDEVKTGKVETHGLFHTSLILSLELEDEEEASITTLKKKDTSQLKTCFLNRRENKLYIPKNPEVALIVDGQHRFHGLKKFYESLDINDKKIVEKFEFPVTFLIGLDIYEVGTIFATVNFKQKPVNKSLYYDIFGSYPEARDQELKIAHDLALHLNNNEKSPIKNMIKLLGRGNGLISQSFFVESIIPILKYGVWKEILEDYKMNGKQYIQIGHFMKTYLEAIESTYHIAWPQQITKDEKLVYSSHNYKYILCKTTGMGAFIMLIDDIYPLVKNLPKDKMREEIKKILNRISQKETSSIFSSESEWGKAGGRGLVTRFYRFLKDKMGLYTED